MHLLPDGATLVNDLVESPETVITPFFELTLEVCRYERLTCQTHCAYAHFKKRDECNESRFPETLNPRVHAWNVLHVRFNLFNHHETRIDLNGFKIQDRESIVFLDEQRYSLTPNSVLPYRLDYCESLQKVTSTRIEPNTRGVYDCYVGIPPEPHQFSEMSVRIPIVMSMVGAATKSAIVRVVWNITNHGKLGQAQIDQPSIDHVEREMHRLNRASLHPLHLVEQKHPKDTDGHEKKV